MKKTTIALVMVLFGLGSIFTSCKKRQEFKKENGQTSEDVKNIQAGIDGAVADANTAINNNASINGRVMHVDGIQTTVCGASVDTALKSQGILTLTFDGSTVCDGRKRSGAIKVTLRGFAGGTRWKDVGAVLQLDYTNFKITRVSDNKSISINGSNTIINVSGGSFITLLLGWPPNQTNLTHKVEGNNLAVTYDDGSTGTFNLSRKFTYTWANNVLSCIGNGEGTFNGISNLENWGTTREGDAFTSQVVNVVKWNSNCGWSKPLEGKLDIKVDAKSFGLVTTFGVNSSGNAVSSGCPWGLKVEWTYNNRTGNKLYQYD